MCKFVSSRISFLRLLVYQYVDVVQVPKEVVWMLMSSIFFIYTNLLDSATAQESNAAASKSKTNSKSLVKFEGIVFLFFFAIYF